MNSREVRKKLSELIEQQPLKVGDVFYTSWGYDQTNIDFIKVVKISPTGKTVKAVLIGQKIDKLHKFMAEDVVADPDREVSEPFQLKVSVKESGEITLHGSYVYIANSDHKHFGYFWRYDGKPLYQSHYA